MESANDMLKQYLHDGDEEAFARLMDIHRPLVTATCRKHITSKDDIEDAAQETFVKLARHAGNIRTNVAAWLRATATTTAIDFARRAIRRQRHIKLLKHAKLLEKREELSWETIQEHLEAGLSSLDAECRSLVVARYFDGIQVCSLARKRGITPSVMSRKITRATEKLKRHLAGLGFNTLEDAAVAGGLTNPIPGGLLQTPNSVRDVPQGLLWHQPGAEPADHDPAAWRRTIRIGVMISEMSCTTPAFDGRFRPVESQLWASKFIKHADFRVFTIAEPDTYESASIERASRGSGFTAGMIDASDVHALQLLDVIYMGQNFALPYRVLDAIEQAVSSGVSLFSEGHIASAVPGINHPRVRRFYMSDRVGKYHTHGTHGIPVTATVLKRHPIMKGLQPGCKLSVSGCGPVFIPRPQDATVLMQKDEPVVPMTKFDSPMPPTKPPAITVGKIGRGRVVVAAFGPSKFLKHPSYSDNFVADAIEWLAAPSLETRRSRWLENLYPDLVTIQ